MNLLIDARTVRPGRSGVGYYTESMLRVLDGLQSSHTIEALTLGSSAFDPPLESIGVRPGMTDYERHPAGEFFMNVRLPALMRQLDTRVFWGPAYLIPWVPTVARKIVTIHDLTVFSHPRHYPFRFAAYLRWAARFSIHAADLVLADSEAVRDDILGRFRPKRIEVVYAAADPYFTPAPAGKPAEVHWTSEADDIVIKPPYVLTLAARDPRKKLGFAARAFKTVHHRFPGLKLVIVGARNTMVSESLVVLPRVSRETLRELYRHATLLLYASAYEGFGMPVLEAMACGCPVAASATGALPEVGGNACAYFSGDRYHAAAVLQELLASPDELDRLRHAGLVRASQFSWSKSAQRVLELAESLE